MTAKRKILEALYAGLHYSGAAGLYSRLSGQPSAVALMYHSVSSTDDRDLIDPDNDMPIDVFEEQMRFLRKNCNVVSLEQLCQRIVNREPLDPRTVLITFDDGYRNNLVNAAPILKKYDLPAIIYLATGYIDNSDPQWIDELYSYFRQRNSDRLDLPGIGGFDLSDKEQEEKAYSVLKRRLVESEMEPRRLLLQKIKSRLGCKPVSERLTLNWDDLRGLHRDFPGLDLGVHTRGHVDLERLDPAGSAAEINNSVLDLERNLGLQVRHFSYPYGRWDQRVRSQVEDAGLCSAVTTEPVPAITAETDIYALPRIEAPRNMGKFKYLVSGAYPRLSQLIFKRPIVAVS